LFVIGSNYALVIGLTVALSDMIPILGTSIIMVPWIAWSAFTGNIDFSIGLAVVYVLSVILRQVLEPKIVGDQLGMHPLVTLFAMYIGLSLFGLTGALVALITVIILKSLQNSGIVRIWNE
jgi:predicted PurR-regulated permease PerM